MKPEDLCKAGTEHGHQMALFCWAAQNMETYPVLKWMYAIPNGGQRSASQGAALKAEGVKSGISDICLPVGKWEHEGSEPDLLAHGLYIEMKKPGNLKGESADQKAFGAFLKEQGYSYHCVDHWEKARDILISYLGHQDRV